MTDFFFPTKIHRRAERKRRRDGSRPLFGGDGAPPTANPQVLQGAEFALTIGERAANLTGEPRIATVINGSLPAPTLRWREGDTVTIVSQRARGGDLDSLARPRAAGQHGRRAGPELPRHRTGPNVHVSIPGPTKRHLLVSLALGVSGADRTLRRARDRAARARAVRYDREHVVLLSDWTDRDPLAVYRLLKRHSDYFDYQKAYARRLRARREARRLRRDTRRAPRMGAHAHAAERPRRRQRRGVHLSNERARPGRAIGPDSSTPASACACGSSTAPRCRRSTCAFPGCR